ncbi:LysR family transcriptional regulator [Pelagibius sp. Alg239-R121]|uniref:LysR family transcriptional regulator n=1 Tax=Pelagibius sp. Alg239-R121 TaxID=2993448 RepID=UPI0024A6BA68|nr:LysR family transcriptional regulator [Pelagibius sp. Alg239-R121]
MDNVSEMDVFVRVVQSGSFSAAARSLDLTPSAISKQIGRLEDRLGARLFNRTTRRLNLTEAGTGFHERCRQILSDIEEAEQAVADLLSTPRGTLKLALPAAFGKLHVAPVLAGYLQRYPDMRIDLNLNDRLIDILAEGMDLAIRIGDLSDSSLIARRLAPNRRVVCGAPAYFSGSRPPEKPQDLIAHNCLVYTYRASRNDWHFDGPEGHETVQVSGNLEANSAEALQSAVLSGVGIGLLPMWLIGADLKAGRMIEVLSEYHVPDSAVYAVYPPGRHLSPKVRSFVDYLAEHFAHGLDWLDDTPRE